MEHPSVLRLASEYYVVAMRHRQEAVHAHHGCVLSTDGAGCAGGDHGLTSGSDSDVAVESLAAP